MRGLRGCHPDNRPYGSPAAADDIETSTSRGDFKGLARGAIMHALRRYSQVVNTSDLSRLISSRSPHENWDCCSASSFKLVRTKPPRLTKNLCHARIEIIFIVGDRVLVSACAMASRMFSNSRTFDLWHVFERVGEKS